MYIQSFNRVSEQGVIIRQRDKLVLRVFSLRSSSEEPIEESLGTRLEEGGGLSDKKGFVPTAHMYDTISI